MKKLFLSLSIFLLIGSVITSCTSDSATFTAIFTKISNVSSTLNVTFY